MTMHQFASGSSAAVSLLGGETGPPVGPETIGRPPSNFEAPPIPLRPFPTAVLTKPADTDPTPVATEPKTETETVGPDVRRLVVRLVGGEEVELGSFDDRDGAIEAAQQLLARFSAAEAAGAWFEVEGRFLRPDSVASIDVLVAG
jgi:hypothetical protein